MDTLPGVGGEGGKASEKARYKKESKGRGEEGAALCERHGNPNQEAAEQIHQYGSEGEASAKQADTQETCHIP